MRFGNISAVLCISIFFVLSCGDETGSGKHILPDAGGATDAAVGQPGDAGNIMGEWWVLIPDGEREISLFTGETAAVGAYLFDQKGDPVDGAVVKFRISGPQGNGAALDPENALTDADGKTSTTLTAGDRPVSFQVTVSADLAHSIDFDVTVSERPTGGVRVSFEYLGPVEISNVDTYLVVGGIQCGSPRALEEPDESVLAASQTAAAVTNVLVFDGLPEGGTYTVIARAEGPFGTFAAAGCAGPVTVAGNETKDVPVVLTLLPLNVVGTYDLVSHYDFTDAIPGQAGDIIESLVTLFNNPGQFLIDAMVELVRQQVGQIAAWVVDQVLNYVGPYIVAAVNDWVANSSPQWLRDFFTVGQDITGIVSKLEVISEMTLDKLSGDFVAAGTEKWTGIALYWRIDCAGNPDPACGRYEYDVDDLAANGSLDAVYASFTARVSDYSKLHIEEHQVSFHYGRLILLVLNEMVLPQVANGAHSIRDALLAAVDCESLAWSITGPSGVIGVSTPAGNIGITADMLQAGCENGVSVIAGYAEGYIAGLSQDSFMTRYGQCDMYEDTGDLMVDRLEDGSFNGHLWLGSQQGGLFSADFRGDRRTAAP